MKSSKLPTINYGVNTWAFNTLNPAPYVNMLGLPKDIPVDPNYKALRISNIKIPIPKNDRVVSMNTQGLILEAKPARQLLDVKLSKKPVDPDYRALKTSNNTIPYPVLDPEHSKRMFQSGISTEDDKKSLIKPSITEMFDLIINFKKESNASDYQEWTRLQQVYKKLMLLARTRNLTEDELQIISDIERRLLSELENINMNEAVASPVTDILKGIISTGAPLLAAGIITIPQLISILNTLSKEKMDDIKNVLNTTLPNVSLNTVNEVAQAIITLTPAQASRGLALLEQAPDVDLGPSPAGQLPQLPSPADFPPISPISFLGYSLDQASKSPEIWSGIKNKVKETLKALPAPDLRRLNDVFGLSPTESAKNLYKEITDVVQNPMGDELERIKDSVLAIAPPQEVALAGVGGIITTIGKMGGFSNASSQNLLPVLEQGLRALPPADLSLISSIFGAPLLSVSGIVALLSTLSASALVGFAISLGIKKLFGQSAPIPFDPSKPITMIDEPAEEKEYQITDVRPFKDVIGSIDVSQTEAGVLLGEPIFKDLEEWAKFQLDESNNSIKKIPGKYTSSRLDLYLLKPSIEKLARQLGETKYGLKRYELINSMIFKINKSLQADVIYKLAKTLKLPVDENTPYDEVLKLVLNNTSNKYYQIAYNIKKILLYGLITKNTSLQEIVELVNGDVMGFKKEQEDLSLKKEFEIEVLNNKFVIWLERQKSTFMVLEDKVPTRIFKAILNRLQIPQPRDKRNREGYIKLLRDFMKDKKLDLYIREQKRQLLKMFENKMLNSRTTMEDLNDMLPKPAYLPTYKKLLKKIVKK